jgi:CubicO group peptidase (beta-lactamase class C family)
MKRSLFFGLPVMLVFALLVGAVPSAGARDLDESGYCDQLSEERLARFAADIDTIRRNLKIPGLSAAVVCDQEMIWAQGFGYADLENEAPATPDTPYGLASVTKPIAAVLIMQLAEEGVLDLDDPIAYYGVSLPEKGVTIRNLLTHTSEGIPGTVHDYNGSRYALLSGVMEHASGRTFAELLSERMLLPLGMEHTALNPLNVWGGTTFTEFVEWKLVLGQDDRFSHYPDVYASLAKPYQFDVDYNIIPGMYHLHHNPGAGGISSVTDLARFDIALDRGLLLGEAAQTEMLTPAYSTYEDRTDTMYGLGWYIQEFEGLELQWHTGRWPPSTSALYLRIPEKELTLIVLANTDNLTVPFNAIGAGDVSKSILALAFFRHFIYPEEHGAALPVIDLQAPDAELGNQLKGITDPEAASFVEKELWSYRQVFASAGEAGQAEKLRRTLIRAFPGSDLSRDWMYTSTAGQNPVIQPILHASAYGTLSRGLLVWYSLGLLSLAGMAIHLFRTRERGLAERLGWLSAALFLGPIAALIYITLHRKPAGRRSSLQQALGTSTLAVSAYCVGWAAAVTLLIRLGDASQPPTILAISYLNPFLAGLLLCRLPLTAGRGLKLSRSLLAEFTSANLGFAALFMVTLVLGQRLFSSVPGVTSPFFWFVTGIAALVALLLHIPLDMWMFRGGYALPGGAAANDRERPGLPSFRQAWPALLGTLVAAAGMVAIAVAQLA